MKGIGQSAKPVALACGMWSIAVQSSQPAADNPSPLRPPAVPLVACDPYFSIWSPADKLTAADTVHWTGKPNRLTSLVRIDDKPFRLMGKEPANVPALIGTIWNSADIWLRREAEIAGDKLKNLERRTHHYEDAEIYINGVSAARLEGYVADDFDRPPDAAGRAALRPGRNLIAVHCHQTGGGQYTDFGFVEIEPAK